MLLNTVHVTVRVAYFVSRSLSHTSFTLTPSTNTLNTEYGQPALEDICDNYFLIVSTTTGENTPLSDME